MTKEKLRKKWLRRLYEAYNNYEPITIQDKEARELMELIRQCNDDTNNINNRNVSIVDWLF